MPQPKPQPQRFQTRRDLQTRLFSWLTYLSDIETALPHPGLRHVGDVSAWQAEASGMRSTIPTTTSEAARRSATISYNEDELMKPYATVCRRQYGVSCRSWNSGWKKSCSAASRNPSSLPVRCRAPHRQGAR